MNNKRGLSVIVSYVLLIIIAISLSALVYTYIKGKIIPPDVPECSTNTYLAISSVTCDATTEEVIITLQNRGNFNINAAFFRMDVADRVAKTQLNADQTDGLASNPLEPGETREFSFSIGSDDANILETGETEYEVEVQPAIIERGLTYPCEGKLAQQTVTCD